MFVKLFIAMGPLCATVFYAAASHAYSGARNAFQQLNHCVKEQEIACGRDYITQASQPFYDRYMSYGLMHCIPGDAIFLSETPHHGKTVVRAGKKSGEMMQSVRLIFIRESGEWKLDIPETLQIGLGQNWRSQLDVTEKLYLALRQQFGNQLDCGLVQKLANS